MKKWPKRKYSKLPKAGSGQRRFFSVRPSAMKTVYEEACGHPTKFVKNDLTKNNFDIETLQYRNFRSPFLTEKKILSTLRQPLLRLLFLATYKRCSPDDNAMAAKTEAEMKSLKHGLDMLWDAPRIGDPSSTLVAWGKSFVQLGSAMFKFVNEVSNGVAFLSDAATD